MIARTYDIDVVLKATDQYKEHLEQLDTKSWLENTNNVALTNPAGDVSLFEREFGGIVTGHYFFHSRGRAAVVAAKEMLEEIFTGSYGIEVIRGLTPLENLGARWMNKQLKFKSYGALQTIVGPVELVMLTKTEWLELKEKQNG